MEKFEIKNRYTGAIMYAAMIACAPTDSFAIKMGMAVKAAVSARANLAGAYLAGAYLADANLAGAYLADANLADANLAGAYLADANLAGAYLADANLADAKRLAFQIPQEGPLIVYKAVRGGVCKLEVPADARRTATPIGRKCRAEWVRVLEGEGYGLHNPSFYYKVGEIIRPDSYNDDFRIECTNGIHFFLTKEEAEAYH